MVMGGDVDKVNGWHDEVWIGCFEYFVRLVFGRNIRGIGLIGFW